KNRIGALPAPAAKGTGPALGAQNGQMGGPQDADPSSRLALELRDGMAADAHAALAVELDEAPASAAHPAGP
ncbi:MAG TPA: hypothetical protein PKE47_08070, partial [Verrucomicrobiota bacterium]|nr:hypothetical protein [Verrucomicrobiota bacterium]